MAAKKPKPKKEYTDKELHDLYMKARQIVSEFFKDLYRDFKNEDK